jgi:hypothetical protein
MVSRRKLEEEIARTKDPDIRKQLQELLDKREERFNQRKKSIKEGLSSVGRELDSFLSRGTPELTPEEAKRQNWLLAIIIIGTMALPFLLFLFFKGFD